MNPSSDTDVTTVETGGARNKGGKEWVSFEDEDDKPRSNVAKEELPSTASEEVTRKTPQSNERSEEENKIEADGSDTQSRSNKKEERSAPSKDKNTPIDRGAPAVILTETVHVNLDRSLNRMTGSEVAGTGATSGRLHDNQTLSTVDLASTNGASGREAGGANQISSVVSGTVLNSVGIPNSTSVREGFVNGDIIVTLLPVNTKWPWITPAQFRPELVPEELMAQGLTLTVEDYVSAMETLTNDVRFHAYNACYKRVLVAWICAAFAVLLALLFSGITGLTLFGLGILWLLLNAAAIFLCMWLKIKLNHNLERCLAQVNKQLLRHRILLGLDDRGKLSCHKVNLCFIYFDTVECIRKLQDVIAQEERGGEGRQDEDQQRDFQVRMDIEDNDIIIQGSRTTRISRKQERAEMLLLRYSQRWAKAFLRHQLPLKSGVSTPQDQQQPGGETRPPPTSPQIPTIPPRHCLIARCPCQFIEEHLQYKPPRESCTICDLMSDPHFRIRDITGNIQTF